MIAVIILLEEFLGHRGRGDRQPQRYYLWQVHTPLYMSYCTHVCSQDYISLLALPTRRFPKRMIRASHVCETTNATFESAYAVVVVELRRCGFVSIVE